MIEHSFREDIFHLLRTLSDNGTHTQRDLSSRLHFSLGKTNYLLRSLIKKGFIEISNLARGGDKLKKVRYHLTRKGLRFKMKMAYHYLLIKEKEYLELKNELVKTRGQ